MSELGCGFGLCHNYLHHEFVLIVGRKLIFRVRHTPSLHPLYNIHMHIHVCACIAAFVKYARKHTLIQLSILR